ncbi:MAG: hypothetical protein Q7J98_10495 [Kiritimatiellia bacterium]|nr:hypothetical protein [Kiritimatiellia bacterium]
MIYDRRAGSFRLRVAEGLWGAAGSGVKGKGSEIEGDMDLSKV